ncbi:hypothetical protein LSH36_98g01053 [Paralvinella palmiformis]|uniref:ADF-H domain-containing protein n=1 Tax=Paralvinella palmiformis TaxID=53620 RepID=A0AAD9K032_9ANNE|nr:hypothetical protein LSH36_98g01053 [Paralvinella palmiformis]
MNCVRLTVSKKSSLAVVAKKANKQTIWGQMALSGVKADQACIEVFSKQKLGTKNKKWITWVSYKISDNGKLIEVEYIVTKSGRRLAPKEEKLDDREEMAPRELWDMFRARLPANDCRYYTYDFSFINESGFQREKLCFITWAPDTADIKSKMLIASSKDSLKKALVGISQEVQVSDVDELENYEQFGNKLMHTK